VDQSIQEFFTSRNKTSISALRVGQKGRLWYDPVTNTIRVSDGVTPGGQAVGGSGGTSYVLPIASDTVLGGIKVGANLTIASDGTLSATVFSGNYNDLTNTPTIPSDVSDLTDTQGLLTTSVSDISGIDIIAPASGDTLIYDQVTSSFVNKNINLFGGAANQILVKKSNTDYDYVWEDMIINLPTTTYTKLIDDVSQANITYIGEAVPESLEADPVWRIQRILFDAAGNVDEVRFAEGGLFDQVWDDRLLLTYF